MIGEFIDGPLWWFSASFFLIGVAWRIGSILVRGAKKDLSVARQSGLPGAVGTVFRRFLPHPEMVRRTRLHLIAGYMFHIGLIALLFWAAPHMEFLRDNFCPVAQGFYISRPLPAHEFETKFLKGGDGEPDSGAGNKVAVF